MKETQAWDEPGHGEPVVPVMEKNTLLAMQNRIYRLCLRFIGNPADARDLTQDTLIKALTHYPQDNPGCVQAWIMRIARNVCLDHLRRRKCHGAQQPVHEWTAIEWQTPEHLANVQEEIRIVRWAITQLPPGLRQVLVMHEYGGLSCQEIGRALNIAHATARARLIRARLGVLRHYRESALTNAGAWREHDFN